jgi:hypothetical protein
MDFLRAIKIPLEWEVKREGPMSLDFTACKRTLEVPQG